MVAAPRWLPRRDPRQWLPRRDPRQWLPRRDPGLVAVRRALRVTIVACVAFYVCRYVVGNIAIATYALFATIALGYLSQIAGSARRRATTLLWCIPVACALVVAGSLVARYLWTATLGMLVFGFLIAYAGVGGPRLVGLTAGMQLMFILPGFPPYVPGELLFRLIGVVVGLGLLIVAELVLWPERGGPGYTERLALAADQLADELAVSASARSALPSRPGQLDGTGGADRPGGADRSPAGIERCRDAAEAIRPSRMPQDQRPSSASRRDRALSHAGSILRFAVARLSEMATGPPPGPSTADLLTTSSRTARATAVAVRGGALVDTGEIARAFAATRWKRRASADASDLASVRTTTLALSIADAVWVMATAVRVALGASIEDGDESPAVRRERFPYAHASTLRLWWQQFLVHLTPRSVYFQGAVRVAVALAAARLVAGVLELQHGFWVLLATLTLLRSRAADTRFTLRPALVGTVTGGVVSAALLTLVG